MDNIKYYYNAGKTMVDWSSEKDIKKRCREFYSFDDIASELHTLRAAFNNESDKGNSLDIYMLPNLLDVVEFLVYYKIKRKLFSKAIKEKYFAFSIFELPAFLHLLFVRF